jgi:hypothetical protein
LFPVKGQFTLGQVRRKALVEPPGNDNTKHEISNTHS